MPKPKFISSITDWLLIATAIVLFAVEILAVFGMVPLITDEFVEISVYQVWVPAVLGILMGHFFPLPWRVPGATQGVIIGLAIGIIGYIAWYVNVPTPELEKTLDILADFLYAFFLGGYAVGSTFFGRKRHPLED